MRISAIALGPQYVPIAPSTIKNKMSIANIIIYKKKSEESKQKGSEPSFLPGTPGSISAERAIAAVFACAKDHVRVCDGSINIQYTSLSYLPSLMSLSLSIFSTQFPIQCSCCASISIHQIKFKEKVCANILAVAKSTTDIGAWFWTIYIY